MMNFDPDIPYSGKLSREKTLVLFADSESSAKVLSVKFINCGAWHSKLNAPACL